MLFLILPEFQSSRAEIARFRIYVYHGRLAREYTVGRVLMMLLVFD